MDNGNKYLLIMPAFNEEMNISEVLKNVKQAISNLPIDILVMDDGSVDRTTECARDENVQVIKLSTNLGNGGAVQTGFRYAVKSQYKYIILFDADGQHDARYIKELMDYIENSNCDMVIGSRYLNSNVYEFSNLRELGTRFFSWIASRTLETKITDCTSGFRIMNRRTFSFLARGSNYPQKYPDADFIIMLGKYGYVIKEYPVLMHERKQGVSMHRGIIKPITYIVKMVISVACALLINSQNRYGRSEKHVNMG